MAPKKEKSTTATSSAPFAIGDIVLGRIKGYPPWPAKIVDPEKEYLTKEVHRSKPKKVVHLVRYYTDGNYSWSPSGELKHLPKKEIDSYLSTHEKKGSKAQLLEAYRVASDPEKWEAEQRAKQEDVREQEEQNANGRDELESEDDVASGNKAGSKRKRGSGKPKEASTAKKAKTETKKKDTKKSDKKPTSKKEKEESRSEGVKTCKDWRHKLQKAFLTGGKKPTSDEVAGLDKVYTEMEEAKDIESEALISTKLPKVLRRIVNLAEIPQDEEYNFKKRSNALLESWTSLLPEETAETASPTNEKKAGGDEDADKTIVDGSAPKENGDVTMNGAEGTAAEAEAAPAVEEDAKAGEEPAVVDDKPVEAEAEDKPAEDTKVAEDAEMTEA